MRFTLLLVALALFVSSASAAPSRLWARQDTASQTAYDFISGAGQCLRLLSGYLQCVLHEQGRRFDSTGNYTLFTQLLESAPEIKELLMDPEQTITVFVPFDLSESAASSGSGLPMLTCRCASLI
jgi:hypothetical protein